MTQKEAIQRVVELDGCCGSLDPSCLDCGLGCPFAPVGEKLRRAKAWLKSHGGNNRKPVPFAREWQKIFGGNMDKKAAIKRLDAIEEEAKKLREIIEKGDKIVYDSDKTYVAIFNDSPYVMAGCDQDGFVFYTLLGTNNSDSYSRSKKTGQECIDYHVDEGFDINVFDDTKEALQFFIDHL